MPRKRDLHPGLFTSEDLWNAQHSSGMPLIRAYAGLWCHSDRNGVFEWTPGRLKLGILPWDDLYFADVLEALVAAHFVVKYEVDGRTFGWIPAFGKRQNPHPKEPALYPLPATVKQVARKRKASGKQPASRAYILTPNTLTPNSSPLTPHTSGPPDDVFEAAWATYPKRPNNSRAKALRAWEARIAEGADPSALLAGVQAYAAYVKRTDTPDRYVKLASTFFGPDKHWETDYGNGGTEDEIQVYDSKTGEITHEFAKEMGLLR